jgi:hypothetical protein
MTSDSFNRADPEQVSRSSGQWGWPLLYIVLVPVVTVPLTLWLTGLMIKTDACVSQAAFIGGEAVCQPGPLLLALAPGLLNLAPILWLWSHDPKTRFAAITATILGGLRLIVPALAVVATAQSDACLMAGQEGCLVYSGITQPGDYIHWGLAPAMPNSESLFVLGLSFSLWLVTLIAIPVIAKRDLAPV